MTALFLGRKKCTHVLAICLAAISLSIVAERSAYRPKDPRLPSITISWSDKKDSKKHTLTSRYLEGYPFFQIFDLSHFNEHLLPMGAIPFRYEPEKSVCGTKLALLVDELIEELHQRKSCFAHFEVLRDRDFNHKRMSGLFIAKCKDYPFVIKLFMENPESFVHPYRKGIVPTFFFFLSGGINRHLSGFTRIKNAEAFRKIVQSDPEWADLVDLPRKWYLLPTATRWLTIQGQNMGSKNIRSIDIPATYCIVADAIDIERSMSMMNKSDRTVSMRLCNKVHFSIDPHIDNFMFERKQPGKKQLIVVVDTEHFPSLVGLKDVNRTYTSQFAWYRDLVIKGFKDTLFKTIPQTE